MIPSAIKTTIEDALRFDRENATPSDYPAIDAALAWLEQQPQAPQPDWSKAPEWAQWWAVDGNGVYAWYEDMPQMGMYSWTRSRKTKIRVIDWQELPIGIDWRATLQHRPQPSNT